MHSPRHLSLAAFVSVASLAALAGPSVAGPTDDTTPVPAANTKAPGMNRPNVLTRRLIGRRVEQVIAAQGSMACENPGAAAGSRTTSHYGYLSDGTTTTMPTLGAATVVEGMKTEPDKNTYLVLKGQHGPDATYDYGTHFVYQGHEIGASGYVTRVNLDADVAHRVTVLASTDATGAFLPVFDGSTWYPFSKVLLFTAELGGSGGVWQATPDWPSTSKDISGALGRGGYEGIQSDDLGNLYIVEDVGGSSGSAANGLNLAKQPNSFVYRFLPKNTGDLTVGGKLQVLQVQSKAHAGAIVFGGTTTAQIEADITSQDQTDLHTYGNTFTCAWVTIHDTDVDGKVPFSANAAAKAKGGTPFKRPENGVFRPGTGFREFFFTATGDTNANTQVGAAKGGFGGLFKLTRKRGTDAWSLSLFYRGDVAHTGLDNVCFLTKDLVLSGEDAGDTLHTQRNGLDSLWMFDANADYGSATPPAPVRVLAEGRDASATTDSAIGALPAASRPGFANDGDNEITGIHVSDGDPSVKGLLGARTPRPFRDGWRVFWSQQHGDNVLWEIIERCDDESSCDSDRDGKGRDRDEDRDERDCR
jgi:hypothetical protein